MNDLLSLRSEVKQLSSLLQQLQSFLKTMSVSHQPHSGGGGGSGGPDGPGGSGSGGGPSGGGSGGGVSGTGSGGASAFQGPQVNQQAATGTATPGQSSRPQQSQQMVYDNKSYHLSPPLDSHSRFVSLFLTF